VLSGTTTETAVVHLDHAIYEEDRETIMGHMTGSCTRPPPAAHNSQWHCTGTYEFLGRAVANSEDDKGQQHSVTVSGPFYDATAGELWNAVLGGTGEYAGSMGEGRYRPNGEWVDVTLFL